MSSRLPAEGLPLMVLLRDLELASSSSEARRTIEQAGVKLDGEIVRDPKYIVTALAESSCSSAS